MREVYLVVSLFIRVAFKSIRCHFSPLFLLMYLVKHCQFSPTFLVFLFVRPTSPQVYFTIINI